MSLLLKNDQPNWTLIMRKFSLIILLIIAFVFFVQSCIKTDKQKFHDFFLIYPSKDVKNIDSYSDNLGINASYWLAFDCEDSTIKKITSKLQLTQEIVETPGLFGGLNTRPTTWWDTAFIYHAKPLSKKEKNLYWYLWYDKKTKRAYFLTFDT